MHSLIKRCNSNGVLKCCHQRGTWADLHSHAVDSVPIPYQWSLCLKRFGTRIALIHSRLFHTTATSDEWIGRSSLSDFVWRDAHLLTVTQFMYLNRRILLPISTAWQSIIHTSPSASHHSLTRSLYIAEKSFPSQEKNYWPVVRTKTDYRHKITLFFFFCI